MKTNNNMIKRILTAITVIALMLTMSATAFAHMGMVYTTGKCHLRTAANLDAHSITTIAKGTQLEYLDRKTDARGVVWYKVSYKDKTGWVSTLNVAQEKNDKSYIGKIKLDGKVNLRKAANLDAKKLDTIEKGTTLKFYDTMKDDRGVTWYLVHYAGRTGWVSTMNAHRV